MKNKFISLAKLSAEREILKKLVFSRPQKSEVTKVSARLISHRGRSFLNFEYSLPGNTVSQKNVPISELDEILSSLISEYRQANLITTVSDAEYKISSSGKEALLGADKLLKKLSSESPAFESAIEELDRRKNYILTGSEPFLIKLGISDKSGRVHDKRQGKFRQINRFLEHLENIYATLPKDGELNVFDLCCGKSYLSFAVYYYLVEIKGRRVKMLGIDLKRDVINWCDSLARELGFAGMTFIAGDITETPQNLSPDLVISLHACDIATDIVLNTAANLRAKIILSTPCCHRYLNDKINNESLSFVSIHPHLKNKLCESLTDGIRIARLKSYGYDVSALELTDPDDTPKNTLIKAILNEKVTEAELLKRKSEYSAILSFVLGDGAKEYLKEIQK